MDYDALLARLDKVAANDMLEVEMMLSDREELRHQLLEIFAELNREGDIEGGEARQRARRNIRDALDCLTGLDLSAYPQTSAEEAAFMVEAAKAAREGVQAYCEVKRTG
mgnify:CR=1 FL=1